MLQVFSNEGGSLRADAKPRDLSNALWIDVSDATPEEQTLVEKVTGFALEAPEDVDRFYIAEQVRQRDGQLVLKALLLGGLDARRPRLIPVTIIQSQNHAVTVSSGSANGLGWLVAQCVECVPANAKEVVPEILDMVIEYATNVLEQVGSELDRINRLLFQHHTSPKRRLQLSASRARRMQQLESILTELGYAREVLVKLRRSVLSFQRLVGLLRGRVNDERLLSKLTSFERELSSIAEAQVDMANGATFMLDGTVGYITIIQTKTINLMTILGVLLTPPVLVASIYGMNFAHMPELNWQWGYPLALGLMVISAGGMYLFMRARNWL